MAEALDPAIPDDVDALARRVLQAACARRLMLATAESCTGGLLASLLTDIPGCSHAFDRGFVVYTEDAKHEVLGVSRALLATQGAVCEDTARAMAEGALRRSNAHIAVSVTGYAESVDPGFPAGLVHFAATRRGGTTRHRVHRFGAIGRAAVRLACLRVALEMIEEHIAATSNRRRPRP